MALAPYITLVEERRCCLKHKGSLDSTNLLVVDTVQWSQSGGGSEQASSDAVLEADQVRIP